MLSNLAFMDIQQNLNQLDDQYIEHASGISYRKKFILNNIN